MVVFDKDTYDTLKKAFLRECKRIEPYSKSTSAGEPKTPRRQLTDDLSLREEYKQSLVKTYHEAVAYLQSVDNDSQSSVEDKLNVRQRAVDFFKKLKDSFVTLNLTYEFEKSPFVRIDINKIKENPIDNSSDSSSSSSQNSSNTDKQTAGTSPGSNSKTSQTNDTDSFTLSDNPLKNHTEPTKNGQTETIELSEEIETNDIPTDQSQPVTMPQSKLDFLQACHAAIDYKYDGDPASLDTFLDAIDLLSEVCEAENKSTLIKFIMTRLEGKAREAMVTTPTETASFRTELKKAIKYESSKVIEGKILALTAERTNLTKFSERAEELCEKYRRSLVDEGYTPEKAKELCVDKTVELCISQSHHDRLKTVLTIKTFKEPKDVIAMMITQINKLRLEKLTTNNSKKKPQNHNNGNKNNFKNGSQRSYQSQGGR